MYFLYIKYLYHYQNVTKYQLTYIYYETDALPTALMRHLTYIYYNKVITKIINILYHYFFEVSEILIRYHEAIKKYISKKKH